METAGLVLANPEPGAPPGSSQPLGKEAGGSAGEARARRLLVCRQPGEPSWCRQTPRAGKARTGSASRASEPAGENLFAGTAGVHYSGITVCPAST